MAELSDAEVFGSTASAPPAAPRELSDAEVFGTKPTESTQGVPVNTPAWGVPAFLRRDPNAPKSDPLPVITDPENPYTVDTRLRLPDLTPAANAVSSIRGAREALAPEPGYVRTPIPLLPLAWKETTPGSGEIDPKSGLSGLKFDLGAALSPLLSPFLDLLEGTGLATSMGGQEAPLAGKVSPAATTLLAGTMMGSPVRQFRDPLARSETGLATSGDLQFGPPDARPPSTGVFGVGGDVRAAPLGPEFTAHPLSPEGRVAATVEGGGTPTAPSTPRICRGYRRATGSGSSPCGST